jgi:hypothetical protein
MIPNSISSWRTSQCWSATPPPPPFALSQPFPSLVHCTFRHPLFFPALLGNSIAIGHKSLHYFREIGNRRSCIIGHVSKKMVQGSLRWRFLKSSQNLHTWVQGRVVFVSQRSREQMPVERYQSASDSCRTQSNWRKNRPCTNSGIFSSQQLKRKDVHSIG